MVLKENKKIVATPWRMRQISKELHELRGNLKTMISLIIPSGEDIYEVNKLISEKCATAKTLKCRKKCVLVQNVLSSVQTCLKEYKKTPDNGLIVYCGVVSLKGNREKDINVFFEPHLPIYTSLYSCDSEFHTEAMEKLYNVDGSLGYIVVAGGSCLFGLLSGDTRDVLYELHVELPKKNGYGGNAASRIARSREERRQLYMKKICELASDYFILNNKSVVNGVVLAGLGNIKSELCQSHHLDARLQAIIVKTVNVKCGGKAGFYQAIALTNELRSDEKLTKTVQLLREFEEETLQDNDKFFYGILETVRLLKKGNVKTLFVWNDLMYTRCVLRDSYRPERIFYYPKEQDETLSSLSMSEKIEREIGMKVFQKSPLVEWLVEFCKNTGTTIHFITLRSEEGRRFIEKFHGLGGLLYYKEE
ncbi:peptide chain release factor eRF1/aRF1 [Spinellus fusiger]|nr:peptide chain release factor eRF1/aRF1 [Spinellus fusiger]